MDVWSTHVCPLGAWALVSLLGEYDQIEMRVKMTYCFVQLHTRFMHISGDIPSAH